MQGEEFLVITEGEYKHHRKVCIAKLMGTKITTDWFSGDFSINPPYQIVTPTSSCRIAYAAKLDYPQTLEDKVNDYLTGYHNSEYYTLAAVRAIVEIAKHHYEEKP